jgi:hypothetical protein
MLSYSVVARDPRTLLQAVCRARELDLTHVMVFSRLGLGHQRTRNQSNGSRLATQATQINPATGSPLLVSAVNALRGRRQNVVGNER